MLLLGSTSVSWDYVLSWCAFVLRVCWHIEELPIVPIHKGTSLDAAWLIVRRRLLNLLWGLRISIGMNNLVLLRLVSWQVQRLRLTLLKWWHLNLTIFCYWRQRVGVVSSDVWIYLVWSRRYIFLNLIRILYLRLFIKVIMVFFFERLTSKRRSHHIRCWVFI